jgi:hypothetical protein
MVSNPKGLPVPFRFLVSVIPTAPPPPLHILRMSWMGFNLVKGHSMSRMSHDSRYSIAPELRSLHAYTTTGQEEAMPPYPTREQYAMVESNYRKALAQARNGGAEDAADAHGPAPAPVRQPPTMLAAMQRVDLTKDAQRKILQKIAPPIATLEKKYKVIFNSDARRDPQHTSPGDFTVDVSPDLLPVRANGFEMIGYSFPQSEWSIEPYENALPMRFGWNAFPGSRAFGVYLRTYSAPGMELASPYSGSATFPFSYDGPTILMHAEQPLVRNPIVRIDVFAADAEFPKRVVLTFARRIGTSVRALLAATERLHSSSYSSSSSSSSARLQFETSPPLLCLDNVGLQSSVGTYPGRYTLTSQGILAGEQTEYFDAAAFLPEESILLPEEPSRAPSDLYSLVVVDPAFCDYFVPGQSSEAGGPVASLGMLFCRPASSARELARRLTVQFEDLIEKRKVLEQASSSLPTCPLNRFAFDFTGRDLVPSRVQHANTIKGVRWVIYAAWGFDSEVVERAMRNANHYGMDASTVESLMNPISSTAGDSFGERMGLPLQISGFVNVELPFATVIEAGTPPQLAPEFAVDLTPIPETVDIETYFSTLNTTASSISYQPFNPATLGVDPSFFYVPIILNDDPTSSLPAAYRVSVPSGEYTPWTLAATITQRIRSIPALRPLDIVVTPSPLAGSPNSLAGLRFTSMSSTTFNLAFNLTDSENQIVAPASVGFRKILYSGLPMYDPALLSVNDDPYKGYSTPASFPAAELGLGVPSPLPSVPLFLPAFNNKRVQITNLQPVAVPAALAETREPSTTALPSSAMPIRLTRATLFHHMQPLRVDCTIAPSSLIFNSNAGSSEAAGESTGDALVFGGAATLGNPLAPAAESFPAGDGSSAGRDDSSLSVANIITTLSTLHDPTGADSKDTLRNVMIRLFGRVALRNGGYGGFVVSAVDMSVDGPYRSLMGSQPAQTLASLSIPPLPAIDGYLTDLANNVQFRAAFVALVNVMLRLINGILGGTPLATAANNNVVSSTLAEVIEAYRNATRDSLATDFTRDFLTDLVNVALWKSDESSIVPLPPSPAPAPLYPSNVYYVDTDQDTATMGDPSLFVQPTNPATVDAAAIQLVAIVSPSRYAFALGPGICIGTAGPFAVTIDQGSSSQSVSVRDVSVTAVPVSPAYPLYAGRTYTLNYAAPLVPNANPVAAGQAVDVQVNTVSRTITFTVRQNISSLVVGFVGGDATFAIADLPQTTLAKMYLVANNYNVSFPGFAQVDQRGTTRHPFDIGAALQDLGLPHNASPEVTMNTLLDSDDPGLANAFTANVVPATAAWNAIPPDLAAAVDGPQEIDPRLLSRELVSIVALTPAPGPAAVASLTVSRINEYAFAMDFVTQTDRRVRCERFGFQEDEYSTATEVYRTAAGAHIARGTIGSVIDVERGNSPYLLLSIDINGETTPAPRTQGPDGIDTTRMTDARQGLGEGYTDLALNGDVISIGSASYPQRARQIIRATAYVEVGTDGSTGLRLLDRQDDRAPVIFPTSTYVNSVRFTIFRPDGTLYNFHGRRTMIGLRFMSWPDNPNFLTASAAPAHTKEET